MGSDNLATLAKRVLSGEDLGIELAREVLNSLPKMYVCKVDEDMGEIYDDCVLDDGKRSECQYALNEGIVSKEKCKYWEL